MAADRSTRVLMVISDVDLSWQLTDLLSALNDKVDLRCLLISNEQPSMLAILRDKNIETEWIKGSLLSLLLKLLYRMIRWRPRVVHTHLRRANLTAIPAARLLGISSRVYTRHSSDYNHIHHPSSVKYDKLVNGFSTDIVSISKNVSKVLTELEDVPPQKISLIHHGFTLGQYDSISEERIDILRNNHSLHTQGPIVGVISRWLELKGIPYIISAFKQLLEERPDAVLVLANATGPYRTEINSALESLPESSYRIIPFEKDIQGLYAILDLHVHTPIDLACEAFGQTYIESLAAGVPGVFTLSGVAPEFLQNEKNSLIVPYKNSEAILTSISRLLNDDELRAKLVSQGRRDVQRFDLNIQIEKLLELYG